MNVIVLGPPGSGKGTQAKLLVDTLGSYYFESGEFSRNLAKKNPRIAEIIESGKLIPEQEMTKYVTGHLEKEVKDMSNIVFDGFPRFVSQYIALDNWLKEKGEKIDKVILLEVAEPELIKRLSARRIDKKTGKVYNLITNPPPPNLSKGDLAQRSDDTPKVIKERLTVYRKNTFPITEFVERSGLLEKIDGARPIKEIHEDILERLAIDAEN